MNYPPALLLREALPASGPEWVWVRDSPLTTALALELSSRTEDVELVEALLLSFAPVALAAHAHAEVLRGSLRDHALVLWSSRLDPVSATQGLPVRPAVASVTP